MEGERPSNCILPLALRAGQVVLITDDERFGDQWIREIRDRLHGVDRPDMGFPAVIVQEDAVVVQHSKGWLEANPGRYRVAVEPPI